MRISDWSSDVCSSDLKAGARLVQQHAETVDDNTAAGPRLRQQVGLQRAVDEVGDHRIARQRSERDVKRRLPGHARSEEHTSELQSLMRISYAVFCLKKKTEHLHNTELNCIQQRHHTNTT